MRFIMKAGLATATLAVAACANLVPTIAADLSSPKMRGPIMADHGPVYAPQPRHPAGPCYFRADIGYSMSSDPEIRWPVTDGTTGLFITDQVTKTGMDNTWFGEAGFGCGSGSRGLRAEVMFGYHGSRDIIGEPALWVPGPNLPPTQDPLHSSIATYTMMLNLYHDLGNFRGWSPYVGAGMGLAYNIMDEVYFTGNPNLVNRINGNRDLAFAWSLMAGVGYQLSNHVIVDFGYRFLDTGRISSERVDSAGFVNPRVNVRDLESHEFKVGIRYHFGVAQAPCCAPTHVPLK